MKNQKTILIGIAVFIAVALLVYHFNTETLATTDYGITDADIECSGDNYVFTGSFYTWCVGTHQVQAFCDDDPRHNIIDFYETATPSSGVYDWSVTYDAGDFDAIMPCDRVIFQLYYVDTATLLWKTQKEYLPACGTDPTPTPTPTPTPGDPDPDITEDDIWVLGGVAAFILLIFFAFRMKPPTTPRSKK